MKNTLLLIVLLQPLWLIAQDSKYFNQSIQPNGNNFTNGISIGKNGANYTIVGETCINTTTRWHPCFMNISQYGNLLQVVENNLIDSISESGMRDLVLTDSTMLGAGFVNDTTTTYSYFALLKKDGAILNKGNVGDTTFVNSCYTACRTHDGGFLIGGECQPGTSGPTHPYLIKLDSAGNKLWDTIYYQYGNSARTWITEIKHSAINNGYYFTATYENAGYNSGNILFSYINEAGDVVKDTIINTAQGEVAGSFVICKDGGFLLGGTQYDNFVVNGKRGLLIKLNANWETEWINDTVRIGGAFVKCLLETADSSFILGGYKKTSPTSYLDACITKINANGNLIWERTYDQSGFDDYAYDMLATNDGGYIACGRTEYYDFAAGISQANLYVLKVNCMGLLTQPQAHFTRTQDALTANFQNLSQFVYPDSIDGGHYIWDFGDGNTSTQANPTHTYAQGGAYNVTLTAVVCSDTSTYTEAVGVWATGIASPTQQQNAWVEISPNPAQDAIQIQHHFADNQTGNFCLFSLDGQLLQNLTLVGDGNYTVGTQAMASGVYFYTLEQDGNLLQRNKIIIIK